MLEGTKEENCVFLCPFRVCINNAFLKIFIISGGNWHYPIIRVNYVDPHQPTAQQMKKKKGLLSGQVESMLNYLGLLGSSKEVQRISASSHRAQSLWKHFKTYWTMNIVLQYFKHYIILGVLGAIACNWVGLGGLTFQKVFADRIRKQGWKEGMAHYIY